MDIQPLSSALNKIRKRPHIYIADMGYKELKCYFLGFDLAYYEIYGVSILQEFHTWLKDDLNHCFSIHSFDYIYEYLCDNNESNAKRILLQKLNNFVIDIETENDKHHFQ